MNLLIVDDDINYINLFREWLYQTEYNFNVVNNGFECINFLQNHRYDYVIIDIFMPEMSGLKLYEFVESNFNVNLVIMSSSRDYINYKLPHITNKFIKPTTFEEFNDMMAKLQ